MSDHVRSTEHVTQEDGIVYLSNDAVQLSGTLAKESFWRETMSSEFRVWEFSMLNS